MIRSIVLLATVGVTVGVGAVTDPMKALPVALVLVMLAGLFSGSETALFSLQQGDRAELRDRRHRLGKRSTVDGLLSDPRSTLASILIGNESVNVLLSTITAGVLFHLAPDKKWLNVVLLPPFLVLFGEVIPKSLAFRYNRLVAPVVAPFIAAFAWFTTPVRVVLMRIADAVLVLVGGIAAPRRAAMHEAHLRALVDHGYEVGTIKPMEKEVIERVFEFGDIAVSRLMTPRPDMILLDLGTPWRELIARVRDNGLSRIPVWSGSKDNIIGILIVKDLLPLLAERAPPSPRRIQRLLHPPQFIPATKRAGDLLAEFRRGKVHQSLVVDEHGMLVGLVTLDDLLAELVGEVVEEIDEDVTSDVVAVAEGVYTVRGQIDIDDFAARFHHTLPPGEYTTLGGFLANQLGAVPSEGDQLHLDGVRFTVVSVDKNRVKRVRVHLPVETEEPVT